MINVSTASESDCKTNQIQPQATATFPPSSPPPTAEDNCRINQNGEISTKDSSEEVSSSNKDTFNSQSVQVESTNSIDLSIVDNRTSTKQSFVESNQKVSPNASPSLQKGSGSDVVDLSSDDDGDNKEPDEVLEIRSDASSDVYILEDDRDGSNNVVGSGNSCSNLKIEHSQEIGKEEDKSNLNDVIKNKGNEVLGKDIVADDDSKSKAKENEVEINGLEMTKNQTDSLQNEAISEKDQKEVDSDTEKSAAVTPVQNSEPKDNNDEINSQVDDPKETNCEEVANMAPEITTEQSVNEGGPREDLADREMNGNAATSAVGVEVVMEVDEVDVDEEVEDTQATIASVDPINANDKKSNDNSNKAINECSSATNSASISNSVTMEVGVTVNEPQDLDNIETITGDRSLSEEAVLKNPDVNVCILSNTSPKQRISVIKNVPATTKENESQNSGVNSGVSSTSKDGTLIPKSVTELTENNDTTPSTGSSQSELSTSTAQPVDALKKIKTVKVLYPKKKNISSELEVTPVTPSLNDCLQCAKFTSCATKVTISGIDCFLCSKECIREQQLLHKKAVATGSLAVRSSDDVEVVSAAGHSTTCRQLSNSNFPVRMNRQCISCNKSIRPEQLAEGDLEGGILQWATMDFCTEECLAKFQTLTGSNCQLCGSEVTPMSMGKYSVRFGYETRQFCTSTCLEEFKKGLKACSYCQRDLNSDNSDESVGFLAPVGEKGQFKDFCSQDCLEKYDTMSHNLPPQLTIHECAVCTKNKIVRLEVLTAEKTVKLCSEVCFAAFKFVNEKMKFNVCYMCKKHFDIAAFKEEVMFYEDQAMTFCSKTCMNVQVLSKRKICPCNWCKVKKYNFDMIRKKMNNAVVYMCSLNCLALYQVSLRATIGKQKLKCDWCGKTEKANFHLTMSDASLRNFCSFECVDKFRGQYKAGPATTTSSLIVGPGGIVTSSTNTTLGNVTQSNSSTTNGAGNIDFPVISSFQSLKPGSNRAPVKLLSKTNVPADFSGTQPSVVPPVLPSTTGQQNPVVTTQQTQTITEIIVKPRPPVIMKNKITNVRIRRATKGISCRPNRVSRHIQTDDESGDILNSCKNKAIIPIPVPIYIPTPMAMYSVPVPTLIPVPIPVPVPIFVPTSKSLAKDILDDIKRIQDTFPRNPIEAELLTMAEAAAEKTRIDNKSNGIDEQINRLSGEEDDEGEVNEDRHDRYVSFEPLSVIEDSSGCGMGDKNSQDDSTDDRDPLGSPTLGDDSMDVEDMDRLHPNHIGEQSETCGNSISNKGSSVRKRNADSSPDNLCNITAKRRKAEEAANLISSSSKPDDHMLLKFTLGVNAWKYFANRYNEDSLNEGSEEDATIGNKLQPKKLRTDLLEMRHDELNQALSLLMKEGKMPNGEGYSPDTKYYLSLGIQYYLLKNGRVDNIFSDPAYESFTDQLDKEANLFQETASNGNSIVTRVQEEHLWESRQLGVHSPHVLLSTLMYLNTKQFNITTLEEHMQLSFSHIMKHSKRGGVSSLLIPSKDGEEKVNNENADTDGDKEGSNRTITPARNVILRFYPSQAMLDGNKKKNKIYEQYENEEDPSRCPVRLYEFYLSRCPESVKTRNDIFYLQPERSCAPDSPVWYSSNPLPNDILQKMLNRIKMVKEINVALVSSRELSS